MLKAIIVDDEIWITKLIISLIDWNQIGIQIIGEAADGNAAFELICAQKPDIVITDIRMAGMDGIDLVKRTREINLNTHFIIISGYNNFEYAQNVMKFGVEDYLLKPIKKTELLNILVKIKNKILKENLKIEEDMQIRDTLLSSKSKLREKYIESFLFYTSANNSFNYINANSDYHFNFQNGNFQIFIVKLDKIDHKNNDLQYEFFNSKLSEIFLNSFSECYDKQIVNNKNMKLSYICLLNYSDENERIVQKNIRNFLFELKNSLEILSCFFVTIGLGVIVSELGDIFTSYTTAIKSIQFRVVEGCNKIIDFSTKKYNELNLNNFISENEIRCFDNLIDVLDSNGIKSYISNIFKKISENEEINPLIYYEISLKLLDLFNSRFNKINPNYALINIDFLDYKNIAEIKNSLISNIISQLEEYQLIVKSQNYAPIRIAKDFISHNYKKNINLEDIANIIHLNPVYFSIIFKKETGENFSDYLINYRLDMAKSLLKNIEYNVAQVADLVGYSNPNYFSKLFKKKIGINPFDYRKIHLNN